MYNNAYDTILRVLILITFQCYKTVKLNRQVAESFHTIVFEFRPFV